MCAYIYTHIYVYIYMGFPSGSAVKSLPANAGDVRDMSLVHWRRKWQPTPAFLPGKSH